MQYKHAVDEERKRHGRRVHMNRDRRTSVALAAEQSDGRLISPSVSVQYRHSIARLMPDDWEPSRTYGGREGSHGPSCYYVRRRTTSATDRACDDAARAGERASVCPSLRRRRRHCLRHACIIHSPAEHVRRRTSGPCGAARVRALSERVEMIRPRRRAD